MKVAFLIEYFPPYATGGSEWSTYYLASQLSQKGINVSVITPNYGPKSLKEKVKFNLIRFPFYQNLNKKTLPGNFFYTNPLWILYSAYSFYRILKVENPDVIHVQGKYSLIGARIANFFLKKPIILTTRDYQLICNYGFCLWGRKKGCNIKEYFLNDFDIYWKKYVINKSIVNFFINILFACWGRLSKNALKMASVGIPIITLSNAQKKIYMANGFRNINVVANSAKLITSNYVVKKKRIIYAGRLTPGKGIPLLLSIIPALVKQYPTFEIVIIGEGFLKEEIVNVSKLYSQVKVIGQIEHSKLLDFIKSSTLVVIPSIWPEPFGRIAIESLFCKTPVVVTSAGGLPEIVNKKWGIISDKSPTAFLKGIEQGIIKNKELTKNISHDFAKINQLYSQDPSNEYIKLYKSLIK